MPTRNDEDPAALGDDACDVGARAGRADHPAGPLVVHIGLDIFPRYEVLTINLFLFGSWLGTRFARDPVLSCPISVVFLFSA